MIRKLLFLVTTISINQFRPPVASPVTELTKQVDQAGTNKFCQSTNGTVAYTCSFNQTQSLTQYTVGMVIVFYPDVACTGNCTLGIDTATGINVQGPKSIKQIDGTTNSSFAAKTPHLLFYNGSVFLVMI